MILGIYQIKCLVKVNFIVVAENSLFTVCLKNHNINLFYGHNGYIWGCCAIDQKISKNKQ